MVGITLMGAYIPMYRLSQEEIGRMWRAKGAGGNKAVAGYDEDAVTMGVAAAFDCLKGNADEVRALYFATTTSPYREKQTAAVIAGAIDLGKWSHTAEFTNSLRAGTSAMKAAMDAAASGSAGQVLVVASDCRIGAPKGRLEQTLGDGAVAVMIGSKNPIAAIEDTCSIFSDFTGFWRTGHDDFPRSAEARLMNEAGYVPIMKEAISELMKRHSLQAGDFAKFVFSASDAREHADLAKSLGFDKSQVQDPLFTEIGNAGTAAGLLTLVAALEEAKEGDRILFANYGDGCDVFMLRVTRNVSGPTMRDRIARKASIDYGTYLNWRDLVPFETSSLPDRSEPSIAARWRERRAISALYGFKCRKCGTPQIHPLGQTMRVCVACQAKDDFDAYKFSDKKGRLFTYAVDQLQPTKNPPGLNGVIDFEGGGRLACELTDYDLEKVDVGMPVEMTFRKLSQGKGIINYFWKAKPMA